MPETPMTTLDYAGFASMTLLVVGAINWGTVAIRYATGSLPEPTMHLTHNATKYDLYKDYPVPDLINLLTKTVEVQMVVYWVVFGSGIVYLLLFIYNSIETRDAE